LDKSFHHIIVVTTTVPTHPFPICFNCSCCFSPVKLNRYIRKCKLRVIKVAVFTRQRSEKSSSNGSRMSHGRKLRNFDFTIGAVKNLRWSLETIDRKQRNALIVPFWRRQLSISICSVNFLRKTSWEYKTRRDKTKGLLFRTTMLKIFIQQRITLIVR